MKERPEPTPEERARVKARADDRSLVKFIARVLAKEARK